VLGMGDVKLALLILCSTIPLRPLRYPSNLELYALISLILLGWRGRGAPTMSLPLALIRSDRLCDRRLL